MYIRYKFKVLLYLLSISKILLKCGTELFRIFNKFLFTLFHSLFVWHTRYEIANFINNIQQFFDCTSDFSKKYREVKSYYGATLEPLLLQMFQHLLYCLQKCFTILYFIWYATENDFQSNRFAIKFLKWFLSTCQTMFIH